MVEFFTIGWKLASLYLGVTIYSLILTSMYSPTPKTEKFTSGLFGNIIWILTIVLVLFPVLWFIHINTDKGFELYTLYKDSFFVIWEYFLLHWQWILIILLIPLFCRGALHLYVDISAEVQLNKLSGEVRRYTGTPYIPPLLYLYILHPPESLLWDRNASKYLLYSYALNIFREKVGFDHEITSTKPVDKTLTWYRLLPAKTWSSSFFNLILFIGIIVYFSLYSEHSLLSDGYYYFIPLVFGLFTRLVALVFASTIHTSWRKINRDMLKYFGTTEPLVPWIELRDGQEVSVQVIRAWEHVRAAEEKNAPRGIWFESKLNSPYQTDENSEQNSAYLEYVYDHIINSQRKDKQKPTIPDGKNKVVQFKRNR